MSKSRTKNSILNLITGFCGQLIIIIFKFIVRTIFIQVLGKSYLGINGLFSDIFTMLSLTELGIDTAINYRLYKPLAQNNDKQIRKLLKFYKKAYTYIGFVIILLGLCIIPVLKFLIKDYDSLATLGINTVLIFMLYLIQSASSYLFFAYRSSIIKADQKTYIIDVTNMICTLVSNILQIVVLLLFKSFVLYTFIAIIFNIINNFVNAIIARKIYPNCFMKEKDSLSNEEMKDMFKDCGALFVYNVNVVVLMATDNLILSSFIGLAIVGLYSNYLLIFNTITNFLGKFYNACKASMGNLFATESIEKKYFFFEVMNLMSIILYGTACIGISICANELITCWIGVEYILPQPLPILIGIEVLFAGIKVNLGQVRNVSGVFRQMWFRPILSIIVNLVASIVLVKFMGIYGVVIGTIAADFFCNFLVDPRVIHKYTFKYYKKTSYYYKKNFTYFLILFIIGIIDMIICNNFLIGLGWISTIIHIITCGITVPLTFVIIYKNSDILKYILEKVMMILKKK